MWIIGEQEGWTFTLPLLKYQKYEHLRDVHNDVLQSVSNLIISFGPLDKYEYLSVCPFREPEKSFLHMNLGPTWQESELQHRLDLVDNGSLLLAGGNHRQHVCCSFFFFNIHHSIFFNVSFFLFFLSLFQLWTVIFPAIIANTADGKCFKKIFKWVPSLLKGKIPASWPLFFSALSWGNSSWGTQKFRPCLWRTMRSMKSQARIASGRCSSSSWIVGSSQKIH